MKKITSLLLLLLAIALCFSSCAIELPFLELPPSNQLEESSKETVSPSVSETIPPSDTSEPTVNGIPSFSGEAYIYLNDNIPEFKDDEITATSFEFYSELDALGRCGYAISSIGKDLMPTEDRESISHIKPSGWQSVKYDIVDGKYLYNRCHLIGFQLAGENANEKNLITGTRYLNIQGMLPFENMVADYVKETGNHVMYRVTPVYNGDDLVAVGVQIEGYSVEDEGDGICFNVFAYNAQPGIIIDYATGNSKLDDGTEFPTETEAESESNQIDETLQTYILNTSTKKYHKPSCSSATSMSESNKAEFTGSREELEQQGYSPCGSCKP